MKINKTLISAAVAGMIVAGISTQSLAEIKATDVEKCYGIAKTGKNDCAATGTNSCAGQDMRDGDLNAWMYVLKGTCTKIVHGSLKPAMPTNSQ